MSDKTVTLLAVGDLILNHPQPEKLFEHTAPLLRAADITVGQNEVPMTREPVATCAASAFIRMPAFVVDPNVAHTLKNVGFDLVSSAGNHTWDAGVPGVRDTIKALKDAGVASYGIGMDLDEARKPVVLERKGTKVGFLSYSLTGPDETWANSKKPGAAYVRVISEYVIQEPCPGSTPRAYTAGYFGDMEEMRRDIEKLKTQCDVVVVHFHQGIGVKHALIAAYERQIDRAAIDYGADLVIGEHAHVCKGIEKYKGKAIFYGMGNFVCSMLNRQLTQQGGPKSEGLTPEEFKILEGLHHVTTQWVGVPEELCRLIGFENGGKPLSQYTPESLQTYIAKVEIEDKRITKVGFLPCLINADEQPVVMKHDWRGEQIARYLHDISVEEELDVPEFVWDGDEVVLQLD